LRAGLQGIYFCRESLEAAFFQKGREIGGRFAEGDKGAVHRCAGLLGGGEELAGAFLEIEVRVVASLPAVGEEVAVKFVATVLFRMNEGEP